MDKENPEEKNLKFQIQAAGTTSFTFTPDNSRFSKQQNNNKLITNQRQNSGINEEVTRQISNLCLEDNEQEGGVAAEEATLVKRRVTGCKDVKAYATVIGGFIYMLLLGSQYMSSSIAPYIASYYGVETQQSQIILPALFVVNMFLAPFGAQAAQQVHPKLLLFLMGVFGLSFVLIASIQSDFWVFCIFYVGGLGSTNAMTYMVPVHHGWLWFPSRPGLVSGLIICGFGFGALIFNNVSRAIVNPDNESSDEDGKFSESVNERVPFMLQFIVGCLACMTLISIFLISPGPEEDSLITDVGVTSERQKRQNRQETSESIVEEMMETEMFSQQQSQRGGPQIPQSISSPFESSNQNNNDLPLNSIDEKNNNQQVNLTMDSIDQNRGRQSSVNQGRTLSQEQQNRIDQRKAAVRKQIQRLKLRMALKSRQFWLIYGMACLSIMFGYYTIDVYKTFGETKNKLNHDAYLTWVGSVGSVFTSLRFFWSAALDTKPYKLIYGILLTIQIALALTMYIAIQTKETYMVWICLALFCEGGHFTLVPNVLKKIFGDQATSLYGITLTYTGLTSLIMIGLLETSLGSEYLMFYLITAGSSFVAFCILIFVFTEEKFVYDKAELRRCLKQNKEKNKNCNSPPPIKSQRQEKQVS